MIDVKLIRNRLDEVERNYAKRHAPQPLAAIADLDRRLLDLGRDVERKKNFRNRQSETVAKGKPSEEEKKRIVEEVKRANLEIKELEADEKEKRERLERLLLRLPNLLREEVPAGKDENGNLPVKTWGEPPRFDFEPQSHDALCLASGEMDFPRGVKLARSRFALLRGKIARLERALVNFMLDVQVQRHGYEEVIPPFLVNSATITSTGHLPKFEEDLFKTTDGLYLIPTAEVPLTGIHSRETLPEEALPVRFAAFTPCFRSEAGSYGKDTKGYLRQHQFNKVELVWLAHPERSEEAHQKLLRDAESILEMLEIPYRTVLLCGGDTGFGAAKCYDVEAWIPSQNKYREISSCSNCGDFQARRAKIKIKPKNGGKTFHPHTLNGSGLATGRTLIALLENHQREDGSVRIPPMLSPYFDGLTKI